VVVSILEGEEKKEKKVDEGGVKKGGFFFYYGKSLRSRGKTWKSEDWSGDLLTTELP
jgi:hypothetical protein